MDGYISIPAAEYEVLLDNSRRLKAVRGVMDEYHMKKKLVTERISEDHMHKLRRKTLNQISLFTNKKVKHV